MSFEAERARIETHFRDKWALTTFSAVPVLWENAGMKQPLTDYVLHRIVSGDGRQMEIVGPNVALHRYVGIVQVDILVVPDSGMANARKMGDAVCDLYRRQQLIDSAGGISTFRTPSVRSMGVISERYRLVVTCPFYRDIRH
jgi:hypothetical protein